MNSEFDIIHQVLDRPTPSLAENVSLAEANMFSRLKHVDILAVLSNSHLVGEIRFLDVINYLYPQHASEKTFKEVCNVPVKTIMNQNINKISIYDDIPKVLQKMKDYKAGTVFVTGPQDSLRGYITIIDLIPWVLENTPPSLTINDLKIHEKLVIANSDDTFYDIVTLMLKHHIRRVAIDGVHLKTIDDKSLKRIFEINLRSEKTMNDIFTFPVETFAKNVTMIDNSSRVHDLARKIQERDYCFVTKDNRMVTPWDVIITASVFASLYKI